MLDWSDCQAVEQDPEKVSGAWIFRGTRVPVSALFENLEGGATLDQFLTWFPGVSRAQAESVLEHAARSIQRFRALRSAAMPYAAAAGYLTDEDVFRDVS